MLEPGSLIDPSELGEHGARMWNKEKNGLIYTGGAGFVDTGHLRHCCDETKNVYDQIAALSGSPGPIKTSHGSATLTKRVPPNMWRQVARAVSYDNALGYEIASYWIDVPYEHPSSFSPEDLCSNYLGTHVAERALMLSGPRHHPVSTGGSKTFNQAVTEALKLTLTSLTALPKVDSFIAFTRINGCWVDPTYSFHVVGYLKRRNFTADPWKVGHPKDGPTPAWLGQGSATQLLQSAGAYYDYTFQYVFSFEALGRTVRKPLTYPKTNFAAEINKIRADARQSSRYGARYDSPTCP
jgi:hypothetical protein